MYLCTDEDEKQEIRCVGTDAGSILRCEGATVSLCQNSSRMNSRGSFYKNKEVCIGIFYVC